MTFKQDGGPFMQVILFEKGVLLHLEHSPGYGPEELSTYLELSLSKIIPLLKLDYHQPHFCAIVQRFNLQTST